MDWIDVIGGIAMQRRKSESSGRGTLAKIEYAKTKLRTPGMLGALGPMIFEVSGSKVQTLRNYKRKTRSRTATHDVIGGEKSVVEYVGGEPSEITFEMQLSRDLGVDIEEELLTLDSMVNSGVAYYFILGGEVIGYDRWYVTELGESVESMDRLTQKWLVTVDVTLKEAVL